MVGRGWMRTKGNEMASVSALLEGSPSYNKGPTGFGISVLLSDSKVNVCVSNTCAAEVLVFVWGALVWHA